MNCFDMDEQVNERLKRLPLYIWALVLLLGSVLSIQILIKLTGMV